MPVIESSERNKEKDEFLEGKHSFPPRKTMSYTAELNLFRYPVEQEVFFYSTNKVESYCAFIQIFNYSDKKTPPPVIGWKRFLYVSIFSGLFPFDFIC